MEQLKEHSVILTENKWNPRPDDFEEDLDKYCVETLWDDYLAPDFDEGVKRSGLLDATPPPFMSSTPKSAKKAIRKLQQSIEKNTLNPEAASTPEKSSARGHSRIDSTSTLSSIGMFKL